MRFRSILKPLVLLLLLMFQACDIFDVFSNNEQADSGVLYEFDEIYYTATMPSLAGRSVVFQLCDGKYLAVCLDDLSETTLIQGEADSRCASTLTSTNVNKSAVFVTGSGVAILSGSFRESLIPTSADGTTNNYTDLHVVDGMVVVGGEGGFSLVDPIDGSVVWQYMGEEFERFEGFDSNENFIVAVSHCMHHRCEEVFGRITIFDTSWNYVRDIVVHDDAFATAPLLFEDFVLVCSTHVLYKFDIITRYILDQLRIGDSRYVRPKRWGDQVIVGSSFDVFIVDPYEMEMREVQDSGSCSGIGSYHGFVIHENLGLTTKGAFLYGFDLESGECRFQHSEDSQILTLPLVVNGRIFYRTERAAISRLLTEVMQ